MYILTYIYICYIYVSFLLYVLNMTFVNRTSPNQVGSDQQLCVVVFVRTTDRVLRVVVNVIVASAAI